MEKRKAGSIQTIVVKIILYVMIPVNLLGLFSYVSVYHYVRETIAATQQDALEHYTEQAEGWLEGTKEYMLRILSDQQWVDLAFERGDKNYELAKVRLLREIEGNVHAKGFGTVTAYWCYVKHTGENIFAANNIPYEESLIVRSWGESAPAEDWTVQRIGGTDYLHLGLETSVFYMGALVELSSLSDGWNGMSEFKMTAAPLWDGGEGTAGQQHGAVSEQHGAVREPEEGVSVLTACPGETKIVLSIRVPDRYISRGVPLRVTVLFANVAGGVLVILLSLFLLRRRLVSPLLRMSGTMKRIKAGETELRITDCGGTRETAEMEEVFNELMDQIYHLEISNYRMELENQKAQLINLQLQINPHLLLNTLNTIYGLAEIGEYQSIQSFTMNLVKYFRYSLKNTDELVTVAQELDFVKSYVEVQKIRYPDKFYVVYDVEDSLLDERIPPLIIQNFVENSVKYALRKTQTEILVILRRQGERLQISICDDGAGMEEEMLGELKKGRPFVRDGETHVGVYNCLRRIRLFYGEDIRFSITSHPGEGTQVWMELPCIREACDETAFG